MHMFFETRVWYVSCLFFWGIVYIYMFCYNEERFRTDTCWRIKSREGPFFSMIGRSISIMGVGGGGL